MILQTIPYFNLLNLFYNIINLDISIITTIEIFILGGMVLFSGKAIQLGLDMGAKAVAIVAGSTMIYKNLKGSGSGSDDNDKDKKDNLIQSFTLPFILSNLDINIPENASSLTNVSYGVFLLSLIALFCFINILGYFIAYILVLRGDYENKYPRLKWYINFYKKTTILSLIIEIIFCFISLLLLLIFSFLFVLIGIK